MHRAHKLYKLLAVGVSVVRLNMAEFQPRGTNNYAYTLLFSQQRNGRAKTLLLVIVVSVGFVADREFINKYQVKTQFI